MRILEVRRHTKRKPPAPKLTQEGVTLARQVGESMGPFALVVTSQIPRAFQTAIAMGFAVDREAEWLFAYTQELSDALPDPDTFAAYAQTIQSGGIVADFAAQQADHWRGVAAELKEGEAALLLSHGAIVEMGAVGCLLHDKMPVDFAAWGGPLVYCEGVRLTFDGGRCVGGKVLRIQEPQSGLL
jgi:broad specificity phosphatase PhoE